MRHDTKPQRTLRTLSIIFSALSAFSAVSVAFAQSPARVHVQTLASEKFEGRLAGSNGERLASEYLVGELKKMGAKPLPGKSDFQLPFEFTAGTRDGGSSIEIRTGNAAATPPGNVVRALSFSDNGDVEGPLVFAGYGIVVPEGQGFAYDSYATLDVKDKVVLVLRYFPEDAEPKTKQVLARYADLRYKAMAARQRGAKAMIVVTGPRSPNAGELAPMTFDTAIAGSGIVAVSIKGELADRMFTSLGKKLDDVQKSLDDANPHATGFAMTDITAKLHADVVREKRTGHNVVAYLPATDVTASTRKPWVAV